MTMGLLSLPVGEADPFKRLQRIHQKFERLKRSSFLISAGGIQRALGVLPKTLVEKLRKLRNGTVFLTNFPGPATRLEFTGCPVEDVLFTGNPVFGTIGKKKLFLMKEIWDFFRGKLRIPSENCILFVSFLRDCLHFHFVYGWRSLKRGRVGLSPT
jgi:hypothetical protein